MKELKHLPETVIAEPIEQVSTVFTTVLMEQMEKMLAQIVGRNLTKAEGVSFKVVFWRGVAKRLNDEAQRAEMQFLAE